MDVDLARDMIRTAFRSSYELQGFLGVLKQRCSPEQYRDYSRGIAAAIDAIGVALINKALAAHPELNAEVEASIARQGQYR
jgi:hypothetical protein